MALIHLEGSEYDRIQTLKLTHPDSLVIFYRDGFPVWSNWIVGGQIEGGLLPKAVSVMRKAPVMADTVSVVICTRDRPQELERCLKSLPQQIRTPDEVIVVDNASIGDATRKVAEAAGVRYIREDRPGLDIARNTGALAASSQIVAYTDDDTELHPHWLAEIVAAFDAPDIMAVTGLVLPARLETEAEWIFEHDHSFGRGFAVIDFDQAYFTAHREKGCPSWDVGAGANMAFRREIFDRIGLFDERLDVGAAGCSGDSEYWYRVLAAGWRCRYQPTAVVNHYHRQDIGGLGKQMKAYMRGHVASLLVQYERTGEKGNLRRALMILPWDYLRRAIKHLLGRPDPMLWEEISGALSGFGYYLRAPKPIPE